MKRSRLCHLWNTLMTTASPSTTSKTPSRATSTGTNANAMCVLQIAFSIMMAWPRSSSRINARRKISREKEKLMKQDPLQDQHLQIIPPLKNKLSEIEAIAQWSNQANEGFFWRIKSIYDSCLLLSLLSSLLLFKYRVCWCLIIESVARCEYPLTKSSQQGFFWGIKPACDS